MRFVSEVICAQHRPMPYVQNLKPYGVHCLLTIIGYCTQAIRESFPWIDWALLMASSTVLVQAKPKCSASFGSCAPATKTCPTCRRRLSGCKMSIPWTGWKTYSKRYLLMRSPSSRIALHIRALFRWVQRLRENASPDLSVSWMVDVIPLVLAGSGHDHATPGLAGSFDYAAQIPQARGYEG